MAQRNQRTPSHLSSSDETSMHEWQSSVDQESMLADEDLQYFERLDIQISATSDDLELAASPSALVYTNMECPSTSFPTPATQQPPHASPQQVMNSSPPTNSYYYGNPAQGQHSFPQQNSRSQQAAMTPYNQGMTDAHAYQQGQPMNGPPLTLEEVCRSRFESGIQIRIIDSPKTQGYRFRYEVEGETHGGMKAEGATRNSKKFPRVQIMNVPKQVTKLYLQLRLVQSDDDVLPHYNKLLNDRRDKFDLGISIMELLASEHAPNDWLIDLRQLQIKNTKKEHREKSLNDQFRYLFRQTYKSPEEIHAAVVKELEKRLPAGMVRIRFDVYLERHGYSQAHVITNVIADAKAPCTADLKVCKQSVCSASVRGGVESYLLCDKVIKEDIEVHFTDGNQWTAKGLFTPADVHRQFCIVYKIPPYKDVTIRKSVTVQVYLFKPSTGNRSQPVPFTYHPIQDPHEFSAKRKRTYPTSTPSVAPYSHLNGLPMPNQRAVRQDDNMSYTSLPITIETVESDSSAARAAVKVEPSVRPTPPPETSMLRTDDDDDIEIECDDDVEQDCAVARSHPIASSIFKQGEFNKGIIPSSSVISNAKLVEHSIVDAQGDKTRLTEMSTETNTSAIAREQELVNHIMNFEDGIAQCMQGYAISGNVGYFISKLRNFIPIQDENGDSTIHLAVIHNQTQALKTLLYITSETEVTASINQLNDMHQTALMVAVMMRNIEMVEILLKHGANPFVKDTKGNSCMHTAARLKSLKMMRLLCDRIKLIKQKEELDDCNYAGYSPLHVAVDSDTWPCAKQLILAGADVNVGDRLSGKTALHHAVSCKNHLMIRNLLVEPHIDVNSQSFDGRTALHLAVSAEDETAVRLIMSSNNADINVEDCYLLSDCEDEDEMDEDIFIGHTPYHMSKQNRKIQAILESPYQRIATACLDSATLRSLSKRLDGGDWRRLAEQLDLRPLIPTLSEADEMFPSQNLIQYYLDNGGTISLLTDSLARMGCHDCVTIVNRAMETCSMDVRVGHTKDCEKAMDHCDSAIGHSIQSYSFT